MKLFSVRSASASASRRLRAGRRLACTASVVAVVVVGCATYDGTQAPQASNPVDSSGAGGTDAGAGGTRESSAGRNSDGPAGTSGTANNAGDGVSDAGLGGLADAGEGGTVGSGGASAGAGAKAGTGGTAGAGQLGAGAGGATAGAGTGGAMAGAAGSVTAGAAGSVTAGAGGAPADGLLSQGKTATADSTETGNGASLANDGSVVTRWCAANGDLNHYWQVDLGSVRTLSRIDIAWEKAANYKFKIEGSSDGAAYALLLDKQTTTSSASGQSYPLGTSPKARLVKVTVTGLPNSTTWASFYEFQVFGH